MNDHKLIIFGSISMQFSLWLVLLKIFLRLSPQHFVASISRKQKIYENVYET